MLTKAKCQGRIRDGPQAFGFATLCLDHYTIVVITNTFLSLVYLHVSDEKGSSTINGKPFSRQSP